MVYHEEAHESQGLWKTLWKRGFPVMEKGHAGPEWLAPEKGRTRKYCGIAGRSDRLLAGCEISNHDSDIIRPPTQVRGRNKTLAVPLSV
jgi:hypothetical protein